MPVHVQVSVAISDIPKCIGSERPFFFHHRINQRVRAFSNVRNPNAGDVPTKVSDGTHPFSGRSGSTAEGAENAETKANSFELYMSNRRIQSARSCRH